MLHLARITTFFPKLTAAVVDDVVVDDALVAANIFLIIKLYSI